MAKFSWDDFLGGLATGVNAGARTGTELASVRNAEANRRRQLAILYPDEVLAAGGRNTTEDNGGGIGSEVGLGSLPIDRERASLSTEAPDLSGVNLPIGANIPTVRPRAVTGLLAQSEWLGSTKKDVDQEMIDIANRAKARQERERDAQDLSHTAQLYSTSYQKARAANDLVQSIKQRQADFRRRGDEESADSLDADLARASITKDKLVDAALYHANNLKGRWGLSPLDVKALEDEENLNSTVDHLLRQFIGTGKTRKAGTRGK